MKATVTSKGQITIPLAIRRKLNLRRGTVLEFDERADHLKATKAVDVAITKAEPDAVEWTNLLAAAALPQKVGRTLLFVLVLVIVLDPRLASDYGQRAPLR